MDLNVLGAGHQELSNLFGGKVAMADRFATRPWLETASGLPRLSDANVCLDCSIVEITEVGTHDVMICSVEAVTVKESAQGLVYFNRQYHELEIMDQG